MFTKTSCYHYFHSHCLGRYITHSEEELSERVKELEKDKTREGAEEVCEEDRLSPVNATNPQIRSNELSRCTNISGDVCGLPRVPGAYDL